MSESSPFFRINTLFFSRSYQSSKRLNVVSLHSISSIVWIRFFFRLFHLLCSFFLCQLLNYENYSTGLVLCMSRPSYCFTYSSSLECFFFGWGDFFSTRFPIISRFQRIRLPSSLPFDSFVVFTSTPSSFCFLSFLVFSLSFVILLSFRFFAALADDVVC